MTNTQSFLFPRNTATRSTISLDGIWQFKLDPNASGEENSWQNELEDSSPMTVPSSFNESIDDYDYAGDYWYEKKVTISNLLKSQRLVIRFGAVTHRATVFINGIEVGQHEGGFMPFSFDITDYVKFGYENTITVKGNNELSHTTLPTGQVFFDAAGVKRVRPYFDFFNYAGINRSVYLISEPQNTIRDYSTTYELKGDKSIVNYSINLSESDNDNLSLKVSLYDKNNNLVADSDGLSGKLSVSKAHNWSPDSPYLYKIVIQLTDNSTLIDEYIDFIGIRTIEVMGDKILLNGQSIYLKGFGRHEDSQAFGRGTNLAQQKQDFHLMKWMGANSFRTSHYPYSEEIYQLADEIGILIIDEGPFVGLQELSNPFLGSTGEIKEMFFDQPKTTTELLPYHIQMVKDLIDRDKNHPSVIMWSLFNEPDTSTDSAVPYFKKIFETAIESDPQKRPRTFTLYGKQGVTDSKTYQFADVIALNRYYGWYSEAGTNLSDAAVELHRDLDEWKNSHINKPLIFTEYGADTLNGYSSVNGEMWSAQFQQRYYALYHKIFDEYPFVKGEQLWNFADFKTTEGIMRVGGNSKGIFTRDRQPKPIVYDLKDRWTSLPNNYKANK
ncbi:beta-glucuronidase [Lentilactobacillus sp. Marseille-Q4993]|uniref:beta-glucuronidase n=1 Tax=Lentilactobacillus sp. Marseille-Q4993 TaxID=3039492 RepID=UPI0024BD48C0|nr:beta-glucuronidase [Lentilactobacillus sp. Marseille-Q4993]